jgi:hypothetical protein
MKPRRPNSGAIYLRGRIYWIKYYRSGQPFRESSHHRQYAEAERREAILDEYLNCRMRESNGEPIRYFICRIS